MEREKMIEEMAKDLRLIKEFQASDIYTTNYQEAFSLISLGYRKIPEYESVNQARKETAKDILNELYRTPNEYYENKIIEIAKRYVVEVEE